MSGTATTTPEAATELLRSARQAASSASRVLLAGSVFLGLSWIVYLSPRAQPLREIVLLEKRVDGVVSRRHQLDNLREALRDHIRDLKGRSDDARRVRILKTESAATRTLVLRLKGLRADLLQKFDVELEKGATIALSAPQAAAAWLVVLAALACYLHHVRSVVLRLCGRAALSLPTEGERMAAVLGVVPPWLGPVPSVNPRVRAVVGDSLRWHGRVPASAATIVVIVAVLVVAADVAVMGDLMAKEAWRGASDAWRIPPSVFPTLFGVVVVLASPWFAPSIATSLVYLDDRDPLSTATVHARPHCDRLGAPVSAGTPSCVEQRYHAGATLATQEDTGRLGACLRCVHPRWPPRDVPLRRDAP